MSTLLIVLVITEWLLLAEFIVLARWLEIFNLQRAMACRSLKQNAKRVLQWSITQIRLLFSPCYHRWEKSCVRRDITNNHALSHFRHKVCCKRKNYIKLAMCTQVFNTWKATTSCSVHWPCTRLIKWSPVLYRNLRNSKLNTVVNTKLLSERI